MLISVVVPLKHVSMRADVCFDAATEGVTGGRQTSIPPVDVAKRRAGTPEGYPGLPSTRHPTASVLDLLRAASSPSNAAWEPCREPSWAPRCPPAPHAGTGIPAAHQRRPLGRCVQKLEAHDQRGRSGRRVRGIQEEEYGAGERQGERGRPDSGWRNVFHEDARVVQQAEDGQ